MKHKHLLSLLQDNYTTVKIVYGQMNDKPKYKTSATGKYLDEDGMIPVFERSVVHNGSLNSYTFKTDLKLEVGDLVVVETTVTGRFKICTVVEVHKTPQIDLDADFDYKWIAAKVDLDHYAKLNAQEQKFQNALQQVEKARRKAEILNDLTQHLPEGSEARKIFNEALSDAHVTLPKL